jgi:hypothetical protein
MCASCGCRVERQQEADADREASAAEDGVEVET